MAGTQCRLERLVRASSRHSLSQLKNRIAFDAALSQQRFSTGD